MKNATETRELIELGGTGGAVCGTYHKTCTHGLDAQPSLIERNRVGMLFLNSLSPTRAANGDLAVYLADSFAGLGYPSFRIDLPGFGDSEQDPPPELHRFINLGGYAAIASAKVQELVARFSLPGVVIVGHCAGTVSAIYTAASAKECKGLVLMDPYFDLPVKEIPTAPGVNELPENANTALLHCWEKVASAGLPILIVKKPERITPGMNARAGQFDYFDYVLGLAGRKSRVVVETADGSNQNFGNFVGREAVRRHAQGWLSAHFPLTRSKVSNTNHLISGLGDGQGSDKNYEPCLKQ